MLRRIVALVSFSLLLLSGCPSEEPKPVAVQPSPSVEPAEGVQPSLPEVDTPAVETDTPTDDTDALPIDQPPAEIPVVEFADIPPAPTGFTGKDQDPTTPIPEDVQRKLKSYEDGYVADIIALLQYPHPTVRQEAVERLAYLDEEDADLSAVFAALRGALQDPDQEVRRKAASRIGAYGPPAKNALPQLAALLNEDNEEAVDTYLYAVGRMGPDAAPLVPQLVEMLKQERHPNRRDVIDALADIGPASKPAVPILATILTEFNNSEPAAKALGRIGAEAELLAALKSDSDSRRMHGAEGAALLTSHSPETVALLLKMATSDSYEYGRAEAAEALGAVRPTTKEIVAALGKATTDEEESVRREAGLALGNSEPKFDEAIPFLVTLTKDKEEWVREVATAALGKFKGSPETRLAVILDQLVAGVEAYSGPEAALKNGAAEFYPLLRTMAKDEKLDEVRRAVAILALKELYGNGEFMTDEVDAELLPLAENLMGSNHPATVRGAAAMLYHFNRNDNEYSDSQRAAFLIGLTEGKLTEVRTDAALILSHRRVKEAIPGLIEMVESTDPKLRDAGVSGLGEYRADATAGIPALIALAEDQENKRRYAPISIIGEIATQPDLTEPALMKMLDDDVENVRTSATKSLAKVIAANDLDATAFVTKFLALHEEKKIDDHSLLVALEALGPKGAAGTSRLLPILKSEYFNDDAANALGEIGPAAKEAVPALLEAVQIWESQHYAAFNALAKIKSGGAEFAKIAPKLLEDLELRNGTLDTLAALGPATASAAPAVAKLLDSEDQYERARAATALGAMGEAAKPYLPKLKELATDDPEEWTRRAANNALLALTPDDPEVLEASLIGADEMRDRQIKELVATLGERAPAVVTGGLKSDKPAVRSAALRLLPEVMDVEAAMPFLTTALDDSDTNVRKQAALHLHESGKSSPKLTAALIDSLGEDNNWPLRSALREQGRAVVAPLVDVVLDSTREDATRSAALEMLGDMSHQIRIPKAKAEAALAGDAEEKLYAASVLALAAPENHSGLAALVTALGEVGSARKIAALRALQRLEFLDGKLPSEVGTALIEKLTAEDEEVAEEAASAIANHHDANRHLDAAHLPALLKILNDEETRRRGLSALWNGSVVDAQLIPPLIAALRSDDIASSRLASSALRQQGEPAHAPLMDVFLDEAVALSARSAAADVLLSSEIEKTDVVEDRLAELLNSDEPSLRQRAAGLLARWDYDWAALQDDLLQALGNEDRNLRYQISSIMRQRNSDLPAARDALIEMATGGDREQRVMSLNLLTATEDTSPEVIDALLQAILNSEEGNAYRMAGYLLNNDVYRTAGRAALLKSAEAASDDDRTQLLAALMMLRELPADELTSEIALTRAAMQSENSKLQRQAAITLAQLDSDSPECVPVLTEYLVDAEGNTDYSVHQALNELGSQAKGAVPALVKLLEEDDTTNYALLTLAAIGPDAAAAVPRAIELLEKDFMFREAARCLGEIGPAASKAIPALLPHLDNRQHMSEATAALAKIEAPNDKVLPALYKHLKDPYLRYDAVAALGQLGDRGGEAVPVLVRAMALGDPELTVAAATSLGQLGPVAADAVDPLVKAVTDDDDEVRATSATAVGAIASHAEQSVPALAKALTDENEGVRYHAVAALAKFKEQAAPALSALIEALDDEQLNTDAAEALGAIGPAAASAAPKLVQLHKTARPYVQEIYAEAIWKIDPAVAKAAGIEEPTP